MSEHEQDKSEDRVEDLDVPEAESGDVKGGLPAIQAAREAARRAQSPKGGELEVDSYSWPAK
jgi:hypothetical protein